MESVKRNHRKAVLTAADRAMLTYAEKLTLHSSEVTEDDIRGLRDAGFADGDIHDIAQIVAYFNYINRVCDGLGVKSEPRF